MITTRLVAAVAMVPMVLLAGSAQGQPSATLFVPPDGSAPYLAITDANWLQQPSKNQLDRAMPAAAKKDCVSGRVRLRCTVAANGHLTGCRTTAEVPEAYGFGSAALSLTPLFRMKTKTADGQSVAGAQINIPVTFLFRPA
jgi:periplasmic protein TonB